MGHFDRPSYGLNTDTEPLSPQNVDISVPTSTRDLSDSERHFLAAMQGLQFGRFEAVRIANGELVLDPWPRTIKGVRFGSELKDCPHSLPDEFALKRQVTEFFEYVRSVNSGEIRHLDVRHGLPAAMEIEEAFVVPGGSRG